MLNIFLYINDNTDKENDLKDRSQI